MRCAEKNCDSDSATMYSTPDGGALAPYCSHCAVKHPTMTPVVPHSHECRDGCHLIGKCCLTRNRRG